MFTKLNTRRKAIPVRSLVVAIAVAILAVTVAYAANITINTDDTNLDSQWYATPYVADDPQEAEVSADMNIKDAWLAQDATSLYFRIMVHNEETVFATGATRWAAAQIDCNVDGDVTDPGDYWVVYHWNNGSERHVYIRPGNVAMMEVEYPLTYGERPDEADNDDNLEWKADTADLPLDCRDHIRVRFHTDDEGHLGDDTTAFGPIWNQPTAVTLQDFRAHGASGPDGGMAAVVGLVGIGALGAVALARRRK